MDGVLQTATAEIVYQFTAIILSAVSTIVGVYVKQWVKTNQYVVEYKLYNDKVENLLDNAISFAEAKARHGIHDGIARKKFAMEYLDTISPDVVHKEGTKLSLMIDRKVEQKLRKDLNKKHK